jgi:hypothetical protein
MESPLAKPSRPRACLPIPVQEVDIRALAEHGFVEKHQSGRSNYYINVPLVALFMEDSA